MSQMTRSALLCFVIMMLSFTFPATGEHVKLCYMYFGSISDLGWTFSFNLGRLATHDYLVRTFPNKTFESVITQGAFFAPNSSLIAENYAKGGCNVILTNNEILLGIGYDDIFTSRYLNISFVLLNDDAVSNFAYPNRVHVGFDYTQGFYVAGAAAAAQSKTCIAFFAAWSEYLNPVAAFSGFFKGVRSVNSTIPLHVVPQNSWYYPDSDDILTNKFANDLGCDVIGHYSDPREVDLQVQALGKDNVFSLGPHSNLQQYVGDSVLAAVYLDWSKVLIPILDSLFRYGSLNQSTPLFFGVRDGIMSVTPVTPLASNASRTAQVSAMQTIMSTNTSVICGPLQLSNGSLYQYRTGSCLTLNENIGSLVMDAHTTVHPAFTDPTDCLAGSKYAYTFSPSLTFSCKKCPAGSYSTTAGSTTCSTCPSGKTSDEGATSCRDVPLLSNGAIIGIVIGGAVVLSGIAVYLFLSRSSSKRNRHAPREAPLCLMFTDVESSTSLWQSYPAAMAIAMETHHSLIREVIETHDAYEVKTVGDSFMIATKSVVDGMMVALDIQRALHTAQWPTELKYAHTPGDAQAWNGLRVRIGLHYCTDVIPKYESLQQYYDYYGNDVNISARVESVALGGQIVMTSDTCEVMLADPDFDNLIGDDMLFSPWAKNVPLKGVEGTVALFSCVPVELAGRKFPPPENCEPETALENVGSDSHTETASRMGYTKALTMPIVSAALMAVNSKLSRDYQKQFAKVLTSGLTIDGKTGNVRRLFSAVASLVAPPDEQTLGRRGSRSMHQNLFAASIKGAENSANVNPQASM